MLRLYLWLLQHPASMSLPIASALLRRVVIWPKSGFLTHTHLLILQPPYSNWFGKSAGQQVDWISWRIKLSRLWINSSIWPLRCNKLILSSVLLRNASRTWTPTSSRRMRWTNNWFSKCSCATSKSMNYSHLRSGAGRLIDCKSLRLVICNANESKFYLLQMTGQSRLESRQVLISPKQTISQTAAAAVRLSLSPSLPISSFFPL